jgi:hypothetical protein
MQIDDVATRGQGIIVLDMQFDINHYACSLSSSFDVVLEAVVLFEPSDVHFRLALEGGGPRPSRLP